MLTRLRPLVLVPFIALLGCDSTDPGSDASVQTDALVTDAVVMDAGSDSDGSVDTSCVVTAEVHDVAGALQGRTRWTYEDSHNITSAEYDEDADGAAEYVYGYTYDDDGKVLTVMYEDILGDESILHAHVYDADDKLVRVDITGGSISSLLGFDYSYEDGLLVSVLSDIPFTAVGFSYDASENVSSCYVGSFSGDESRYSYGPAGNRLTRDSFYSSAEEYSGLVRSTMTYDSEGNPLTEDVHDIEFTIRVVVGELLIHRAWTHDAAGNVLTRETDLDADGSVDQRTTWTHECGSLPASALPVPERIQPVGVFFPEGYLASLCPR